MLPRKIGPILLICFFLMPVLGISQASEQDSISTTQQITSKDSIDFFASTTIFQKIKQDSFYEVILKTDFDSLIKNKKISSSHYPGTILLKNGKGAQFKMKVKIEPRGRSRRKVCSSMPPLKIDFPKKALKELGLFPGCDKLKLVTNCNDTENSDQVLMKEYWIYNLYNQVTPHSFQVFPIKITYINTNDSNEKIERFAFFIESNKELELRLKGKATNGFGTTPVQIEPTSYHNTLLFQYMIGNLDWDITVQRNVKLIQPDAGGKPILVPYDFDFSGLVKAPHARLNPDYQQRNIEERFPQGKFPDKTTLMATATNFQQLEKDGFRCYMSCTILEKSVKKKMNKYLTSFFRILKDKPYLRELFLEEG
ncbi:MAG: hypothetical protein AB8G86_14340 [Saprospiraceae bacterium]